MICRTRALSCAHDAEGANDLQERVIRVGLSRADS